MLKTSRYLILTGLFVLVFIIFMTFNAGIYSVDSAEMPEVVVQNLGKQQPSAGQLDGNQIVPASKEHLRLAVVTGPDSDKSKTAKNALFAVEILKQPSVTYTTVQEFAQQGINAADVLIIATDDIHISDLPALKKFIYDGGDIIFAVMPSGDVLDELEFQEMLGIANIHRGYTTEGIDIYSGMLLGGIFHSSDWKFKCLGVSLEGNCKVFANALDPKRDKNEKIMDPKWQNPIIWRSYFEGSMVYAINAPLMEQDGGIGLLVSIIAEREDDLLYPVIAEKAVILESFPLITETDTVLYNRSSYIFLRDVVWPRLFAMSRDSDLSLTGLVNSNFAQNKISSDIISFFAREIYKTQNGEIGYLLPDDPSVFEADMAQLERDFNFYKMRTFLGDASKVSTDAIPEMTAMFIRGESADAFSWLSDRAIALPVISRGVFDEKESLKYKGMLTAMGVAVHGIDMSVPYVTNDPEKEWNLYMTDVSKYLRYLFKKNDQIPVVRASQLAECTKNYMNTTYDISATDNGFRVKADGNTNKIFFILRTKKQLTELVNCSSAQMEEGFFLISSDGPEFEIVLAERSVA